VLSFLPPPIEVSKKKRGSALPGALEVFSRPASLLLRDRHSRLLVVLILFPVTFLCFPPLFFVLDFLRKSHLLFCWTFLVIRNGFVRPDRPPKATQLKTPKPFEHPRLPSPVLIRRSPVLGPPPLTPMTSSFDVFFFCAVPFYPSGLFSRSVLFAHPCLSPFPPSCLMF